MDLEPFTANPVVPLPDTPACALRRRARALQGVRRPRRRVASRRASQCPMPCCTSSAKGRWHLSPSVWSEELPGRVEWSPSLTADDVAAALDSATLLVLPSRSEGMGRVVIEAGCRGRAVVGSRVGGIPDVVVDGETGVLVPPDDAGALAEALERVLSDRELADRLGAEAHVTSRAMAGDARGVRTESPRSGSDRPRRPPTASSRVIPLAFSADSTRAWICSSSPDVRSARPSTSASSSSDVVDEVACLPRLRSSELRTRSWMLAASSVPKLSSSASSTSSGWRAAETAGGRLPPRRPAPRSPPLRSRARTPARARRCP